MESSDIRTTPPARRGSQLEYPAGTVVYTTDRAYREQVYPIFKSYFTIPPCGTGLIVDGLARPELVVEIDCWGFIDDPD